jgi:hypothetical protein
LVGYWTVAGGSDVGGLQECVRGASFIEFWGRMLAKVILYTKRLELVLKVECMFRAAAS